MAYSALQPLGGRGGCYPPGPGIGGIGGTGHSRPAPSEPGSFEGLTATLERRFGQRLSTEETWEQLTNCYHREGERLGTLAAHMHLHKQCGYPLFRPADQEDLALYAFLRVLSQEHLQQHVSSSCTPGAGRCSAGSGVEQQATSW